MAREKPHLHAGIGACEGREVQAIGWQRVVFLTGLERARVDESRIPAVRELDEQPDVRRPELDVFEWVFLEQQLYLPCHLLRLIEGERHVRKLRELDLVAVRKQEALAPRDADRGLEQRIEVQ